MADNGTSELAEAIQEVTERASLLVREEVELAKTEMTEKVTKLIKGAVVGIVAGIFAVAGLIYLLNALSWGLWDLLANNDNYWLGFLIVAILLFLLGGLAGILAQRSLKKGSPPTPQMAIEEAQLIRETVTNAQPAKPQGATGAVQAPNPARTEAKP